MSSRKAFSNINIRCLCCNSRDTFSHEYDIFMHVIDCVVVLDSMVNKVYLKHISLANLFADENDKKLNCMPVLNY